MIDQLVSNLKKFSVTAAVVALALAQASCGKDPSASIWIDVVPTQPVVVTADFQMLDPINSTPGSPVYIAITAPWFKFSYNLTNTNSATSDATTNTVTIVAVDTAVTGFTMTGTEVFASVNFSASDASGYDATSSPPYLAEVLPGHTISAGNNTSGAYDGTNYAGDFYADSLPDLTGATAGGTSATPVPILNTYNYQIRATFTGWFGTFDNPQKRFTKVVTFSTQ